MNIGRKIYYDKITGSVLVNTGEHSGNVRETTTEEDSRMYKTLSERNPETVGMIQLEYGQYAQDFAECNGYRVNIELLATLPEGEAHKALEFSYPDPNLPPEEQEITYKKPLSEEVADLKQSIAELTILLSTPQA